MKQILTVFRFTFMEAVRKKAFLIITAIVLLLIFAASAIPAISEIVSSPDDGPDKSIYFVSDTDRVPGAKEAITALFPEAEVITGDILLLEKYRDEVRVDADKAIIEVTETDSVPGIRVTAKTFMSFVDVGLVSDALTPIYIREEMKKSGASDALIELSQTKLENEFYMAGNMNLSGYYIGIVLLLIMFFAIYYYGYGVSMSIANEKASRVMETLIVSAKPSHVLIGKCLGMGLLGLAQLSAFLLAAVAGYLLLVPKDFTIMGMPISLSTFTFSSAVLVLLYFVLGFALYAVMNAVCGALVDKIEDLNSAMMPVAFISMISFYVGYFTAISDTAGIISKFAVYVPFTSPFVVPFKILNSDIPASDIAISIALLLAAVVVVAWFSARLYTASVLRYGKRLRIKELYRKSK
ncbi:ABC transporter permease [Candidatus Saccharibacteria bacterium]|nr:ABC transporter permease [Candidatus Saccharibacteria bacterium]NLO63042.1 ABC transporter permease [Clostridiaceae bacterium]